MEDVFLVRVRPCVYVFIVTFEISGSREYGLRACAIPGVLARISAFFGISVNSISYYLML